MSVRPSPTVSIIVVTYNSGHVIGECLAAVRTSSSVEIIVIDNDSSDDTLQVVASVCPDAIIVRSGGNLGFAKAVNRAAALANGSFFFLLNPDAIASAQAVRRLAQFLTENEQYGACAPLVVDPAGEFATVGAGNLPTIRRMFLHSSGLSRLSERWKFLEGHYLLRRSLKENMPRQVEWVSGGCVLIRRDDWLALGGLSERWFMYAEDIEFCLRLVHSGKRIALLPDVAAIHAVGGSSRATDGRSNTAWLTNLYEMYCISISRGPLARLVWRLVVAGGFGARSALFGVRAATGKNGSSALQNARRFHLYASALMKAKTGMNHG